MEGQIFPEGIETGEGIKPESSLGEKTPEQPPSPSEQEAFSPKKVIQQEFGLTPTQVEKLREMGINFDTLMEELTDEDKRGQFFQKLKGLEGLTDEQKGKIEAVETMFPDNEQPTTPEQIIERLKQRKSEIETFTELSQEEKQKALEGLQEIEKSLTSPLPPQEGISQQEREEERRERFEQTKQKVIRNLEYLGIGLGVLLLIFALQGSRQSSGGG